MKRAFALTKSMLVVPAMVAGLKGVLTRNFMSSLEDVGLISILDCCIIPLCCLGKVRCTDKIREEVAWPDLISANFEDPRQNLWDNSVE